MNGNFKIRALETWKGYFNKGDILEFKDGRVTWLYGGISLKYKSFEDFIKNNHGWKKCLQLIKEEDLREFIKPCYVVKFENGELSKVEINDRNKLCFSGGWCGSLLNFDRNLIHTTRTAKIVEIYGYCKYNDDAYKLSTNNRELIWSRPVEKSPTQLEIESIETEMKSLTARLTS